MGYQNGLITAPVSVWDVRRALGSNSTDLGTLCTESKINKWARYKPVRCNKIGIITENDRKGANYGMYNKPQELTDIYLIRLARDCMFSPLSNYWVYQQPRGANFNEHYRLSDFVKNPNETIQTLTNGYNVGADVPFASDLVNAMTLYSGGQYNINKAEKDSINFVAYELATHDMSIFDLLNITTYSDYCLAVDIYDTDPITTSTSVPIPILTYEGNVLSRSQSYSEVVIPTSTFSEGVYYALIGVMRVQSGSRVSGSAFLAPRTNEQVSHNRSAFYFKLNIQNYLTMKFEVLQVTCTSNSGWFTQNGNIYETSSYINGILIVHLRVSRTTQTYYFANGTATIPPGANRMQIYLIPYRWNGNYEARPLNSSRQYATYTEIPAATSTTTQWVDLYAQFDLSGAQSSAIETILNDGYNGFAMRATINGSEQRDCGGFYTHKL